MGIEPEPRTYRFDAFISYRHVEPDRKWAKWLHGALETYRVPKELVAKGLPKKLTRVFRDEEELPANADLSTQITAALEESKFLIVVCSPRAVESRWVNAEVEHFRKLGRHNRILALLIEGEPGKAFPPALTQIRRTLTDASGQTRDEIEEVEPLAADVRPERTDTKAHVLRGHARLRLLACILGCRFDDLRQREAERRAQRMKLIGAGLATLVIVLSALTGYAFVQRNEAIVQKANAETQTGIAKANAEAAEQARAEEKARADELKKVSDFQAEMLRQIDTTKAGIELMKDVRERHAAAMEKEKVPKDERLNRAEVLSDELTRVNATDTAAAIIDRTILEPAIKAVDEQFSTQPVVNASLKQTLARIYLRIGLHDKARAPLESALAIRRRVLGEEHPDTLMSINDMGGLLGMAGKLAEAEPFYREALEKRRRVLGDEHPETLATLSNLGDQIRELGRFSEAEPYLREALETRRRVQGPDHDGTRRSLCTMGLLRQAQGRYADAEALFREAMDSSIRTRGPEDSETLDCVNYVGAILQLQQRYSDAEPYWRDVLEKRRRMLGEDHPATLDSVANMGLLMRMMGRFADAEPLETEAFERSRRVLGKNHPDTLLSAINVGSVLRALGRFSEAESYFRDALARSRSTLGDNHPSTLIAINCEGIILKDLGRLGDAEPFYVEALERSRQTFGVEHPNTLRFASNLGGLFFLRGKIADAEPLWRGAFEGRARALGKNHADTLDSARLLGTLLRRLGRLQEAVELLTVNEDAARQRFSGSNGLKLAEFDMALGLARGALGYDTDRFQAAEANLVEAHPIFVKARGEKHKDTLECVQGLVELYTAWDKAEPGKGYDAKAAEWQAKLDAAEAAVPETPAPAAQTSK